MKLLVTLVLLLLSQLSFAQSPVPHAFTEEQLSMMEAHNQIYSLFQQQLPSLTASLGDPQTLELIDSTTAKAYAEYDQAGYLIFSSGFHYQSKAAKLEMARQLPQNMQLLIYSDSSDAQEVRRIQEIFAPVIDLKRLKVIEMPESDRGFWARDGVPVPVHRQPKEGDELFTLVDARYYHKFEPDKQFSTLFDSQLTQHEYFFEGGNFIANSKNVCLVVNNRTTKNIPDEIFKNHYGCLKLLRLPHVKGIGHADESVKFMDDVNVITDEPRYIKALEEQGYKVTILPRPQREYETYVNSLITNGVVFVPIFNQATDNEVLEIYRSFGLKAVGLDSRDLSNNGLGSIHCITMTYPPHPLSDLLKSMGARLIEM